VSKLCCCAAALRWRLAGAAAVPRPRQKPLTMPTTEAVAHSSSLGSGSRALTPTTIEATACLTQVRLECEEMDAARGRLLRQLEESTQQLQRIEVEVKRTRLDLEAAGEELRTTQVELNRRREELGVLREACQQSSDEEASLRSQLQAAIDERKQLTDTLKDVLLEVSGQKAAAVQAEEQRLTKCHEDVSATACTFTSRGNSLPQVSVLLPRNRGPNISSACHGSATPSKGFKFYTGACPSRETAQTQPSPVLDLASSKMRLPLHQLRDYSTQVLPNHHTPSSSSSSSSSHQQQPQQQQRRRRRGQQQQQRPRAGNSRIERARSELEAAQAHHGEQSHEALHAATELALLLEERSASLPEARRLLRRALAGFEALLGAEHLDTLRAANNLAVFLDNAGEKEEALALYRRASAGRRQHLGGSHPYTLDTLYNLASSLRDAGHSEEAEEVFLEVRQGCMCAFGPRHHGTLDCTEQLAELLETRGALEDVQALYGELLKDREAAQGPHHPDVLRTLVKLASVLTTAGRLAEAEEAQRDAVRRHGEALGLDDPTTVELTYNLAAFLESIGKMREAEQVLRSSLAACEGSFGANSPVALGYTDNLAILLEGLGQRREAEALFRHTLQRRHCTLGWEHEDTLRSAANLAVLFDLEGQADEALQLYRRVLAGRAKALGEDHHKTLESKYSLAMHLADHGNLEESASLFTALLFKFEGTIGPDSEWALACAHKLGEIHKDRKELFAAEAMFRRILESPTVRGGPQAADAAYNLAVVLAQQGLNAEAEPLFRASIRGYSERYSPKGAYTLDAIFSLAACVEALGRQQEARELYNRTMQGCGRSLSGQYADLHQAEATLTQSMLPHGQPPSKQQQPPVPISQVVLPIAPAGQSMPTPQAAHMSFDARSLVALSPTVPSSHSTFSPMTPLPEPLPSIRTSPLVAPQAARQAVAPLPSATSPWAALEVPQAPVEAIAQTCEARSLDGLPLGAPAATCGTVSACAGAGAHGASGRPKQGGTCTHSAHSLWDHSPCSAGAGAGVAPEIAAVKVSYAQTHQQLQQHINELQTVLQEFRLCGDEGAAETKLHDDGVSAVVGPTPVCEPVKVGTAREGLGLQALESTAAGPALLQAEAPSQRQDPVPQPAAVDGPPQPFPAPLTSREHPQQGLQFFRVGYEKAKQQLGECDSKGKSAELGPSRTPARTETGCTGVDSALSLGGHLGEMAATFRALPEGRGQCAAIAGFEVPAL